MENSMKTRELLIEHCRQYPRLQIRDIFKFIYQSSFGCEHMVASCAAAKEYIRKESENILNSNDILIDTLDGDYSRVHLAYLKHGLSIETFAKLFFLSAKTELYGKANLEEKLNTARTLVCENLLPFNESEFDEAAEKWKSEGYPAVHHSDVFRNTYNPAYRVIADKFIPFIPLFAKLDKMLENGNVILAVEGGSASGKTTLSKMLEDIYDCAVFHMDDFFLRPEQRTPERYKEVGGNIDRERFLAEVITPLIRKEAVAYRRFDCSDFTLSESVTVLPKKLTVIEGVYSMHPYFGKYYDVSAFLNVSPELQHNRIAVRNSPQLAQRFYNEWIPLEEKYFSEMNIKQRCDIKIEF